MKKGLTGVLLLLFFSAFAQNRTVVIMGSSTAEGIDATTYSNSWAGKIEAFYNRNNSPGNPDTIFYNIAVSGRTTWHEMPDGYVNPSNRPQVSEGCFDAPYNGCNVTKALSYNPDIIIINLPTNDVGNLYAGYNPQETMDNFRYLFNYINAAGVKCFIATTQPRNDLSNSNRTILRRLVDSIKNNFGVYSIDFWTDLAPANNDDLPTSDRNKLKDEVRSAPSPYHLNNAGHNYLYERVKTKNIFEIATAPLPLVLKDFRAQAYNDNEILIKWATTDEEAMTSFEIQRSVNGADFETVFTRKANGAKENAYSWVDRFPLQGKSFYRLKIMEPSKAKYSKVLSVIRKQKPVFVSNVFLSGSVLNVKVQSILNQQIIFTIIDNKGVALEQKTHRVTANASHNLTLDLAGLPSGQYYLKLQDLRGNTDLRRFIK
jgi:lysophospholipase L1-like esterase